MVDLPAPLGPTSATSCPGSASNEMSVRVNGCAPSASGSAGRSYRNETSRNVTRPWTSSWLSATRARLVPEGDRQIKVFEDAVEEGEGALDLDLDIEQLPEREEEPALQRREGDDIADGHRAAADDFPPGDQVDERGRDREKRADDHEEPAPDHLLRIWNPIRLLVLGPELGDLVRLPPKCLGQQHAADRERLFEDRRHVGQDRCVLDVTSRRA